MRKWFSILVALLFVVVAARLALRFSPPREPSWKGRKLSAWIHDFVGMDPALESATMEAVRGMGTNIIPFIRAELHHRDNPVGLKLLQFARKQTLVKFHSRTADELHEEAAMIYSFAETSVKGPLVSDWIYLVDRGGPNELRTALMSHGGRGDRSLGPEALAPLEQALGSTNERVRLLAVVWLKCIPDRVETVVAALVQKLADPNLEVRGAAALTLGNLGQEPKTAVPALLHALTDPNAIVRQRCVRALGAFTNEVPSIAPSLQKALEDPDRIVRAEAEHVLKRMALQGPTSGQMP